MTPTNSTNTNKGSQWPDDTLSNGKRGIAMSCCCFANKRSPLVARLDLIAKGLSKTSSCFKTLGFNTTIPVETGMSDPYRLPEDLPHGTVSAANTLDDTDRELPQSDWLPIGADTRWQATVRLIEDLEQRGDFDTVRILLQLAKLGQMETEDVERALEREAKIIRSNQDEDRPGGRPSKVDKLAQEIGSSCSVAAKRGYVGADDQVEARNRQIQQTLRNADISRSTYYRLRDHVQTEHGLDISDVAPSSDVVF